MEASWKIQYGSFGAGGRLYFGIFGSVLIGLLLRKHKLVCFLNSESTSVHYFVLGQLFVFPFVVEQALICINVYFVLLLFLKMVSMTCHLI